MWERKSFESKRGGGDRTKGDGVRERRSRWGREERERERDGQEEREVLISQILSLSLSLSRSWILFILLSYSFYFLSCICILPLHSPFLYFSFANHHYSATDFHYDRPSVDRFMSFSLLIYMYIMFQACSRGFQPQPSMKPMQDPEYELDGNIFSFFFFSKLLCFFKERCRSFR